MTRLLATAAAALLPFTLPNVSRREVGVQPRDVAGAVFVDRNNNGRRDAGEPGLGGVVVSDQDAVAVTDQNGAYRLATNGGRRLVYVSVPDGYEARGPFWATLGGDQSAPVDFALRPRAVPDEFTFVHASDTHISQQSLPRLRRLRALVDSIQPSFLIITGDLVRDALRVPEAEARGYYELFGREEAEFRMPLWTVPGNHENFGIERRKSGVSAVNPLYGRAMYRHYRGPDYYSFNAGGIHFVALNTVDIDDTAYYGHVDSLQLAWLARDLETVPAATPVVTFNHIPFFTAVETMNGYQEGPPAPSVITVNGKGSFRHSVSNAAAVLARVLKKHPYPLALGGHMHVREALRYAGFATRFDQAAAVVGPSGNDAVRLPSGVTVYRVRRGVIAEGEFVPLGLEGKAAH